ncbi:hypothetical protein MASR2M15_21790 [Anaerolineales bacterium]
MTKIIKNEYEPIITVEFGNKVTLDELRKIFDEIGDFAQLQTHDVYCVLNTSQIDISLIGAISYMRTTRSQAFHPISENRIHMMFVNENENSLSQYENMMRPSDIDKTLFSSVKEALAYVHEHLVCHRCAG